MNIVLANQWYPPESGWGGVAMWNHVLAHALQGLGHRITVITTRYSNEVPAEQTRDGIRVKRILVQDAYRARQLPGAGRYIRTAQQLGYARRVEGALRALHRERPIDAIEFADVNAEGFFYARAPKAPVIVRCHTPTFVLKDYYTRAEMRFDTRIIGACEKSLIRHAHRLTAPSQDMANVISQSCNIPPENISVIPNALCLNEFPDHIHTHDPGLPLTVLYVGRLERVKGAMVIAQAIPEVIAQASPIKFVFVGEDLRTPRGTSQRAEIEQSLDKANALKQVQFVGDVDQRELLDWYARADICVVPSLLYESFSYTCAQSLAAGKPVVASRWGGIPETVDDGLNGILVEPGNATKLADAIVRLAHDPALRAELGRAGRAKAVREFDAIKIAQQCLRVYEKSANAQNRA